MYSIALIADPAQIANIESLSSKTILSQHLLFTDTMYSVQQGWDIH